LRFGRFKEHSGKSVQWSFYPLRYWWGVAMLWYPLCVGLVMAKAMRQRTVHCSAEWSGKHTLV